MEMELRMLEDLAESIVNDFAYMRAREEQMRDTNGMYSKHTIDREIFAVKIFSQLSKFAKIVYAIFFFNTEINLLLEQLLTLARTYVHYEC